MLTATYAQNQYVQILPEFVRDSFTRMARKGQPPQVFLTTLDFTGAKGWLDRGVGVNSTLEQKRDYAFRQFDVYFHALHRSLTRPSCLLGFKCVDSPLVRPNEHDYRVKAFAFLGVPGDKVKQSFRVPKQTRAGVHVHAIFLFHDSMAQKFSGNELREQMARVAEWRLVSALEGIDIRPVPALPADAGRIVGYLAEVMRSNLLGIGEVTRTDLLEVWPRWS
jgi:hypothetical protein